MTSFGSPPGGIGQQQGGGAMGIAPNDCKLPEVAQDGISSLSWHPTNNILAASSWDSTIRCWELANQNGNIQARIHPTKGT
jgi:WD40 repeat protein